MKLSHDPDDDQAARPIIDAQLRRPDEAIWAELYSDTYARQTHRILLTVEDATVSSLTHRGEDIGKDRERYQRGEIAETEWMQLVDDYGEWRKRATHVLTLVRARKRYAADRANALRGFDWGQDVLETLRTLAQAVAEHRAASEAAGIEPEQHDQLLWLRLETLRVTTSTDRGRAISLTELLTPTPPARRSSAEQQRQRRTGRKIPSPSEVARIQKRMA